MLRLITVVASSLSKHEETVGGVIGIVLLESIVLLLLTKALAVEIGLDVGVGSGGCRWLRHVEVSVDVALRGACMHGSTMEV